jgi:hypothetical protein
MGMIADAKRQDWITGFAPINKKTAKRHTEGNKNTFTAEPVDYKEDNSYRKLGKGISSAPTKTQDVKRKKTVVARRRSMIDSRRHKSLG